MGDGLFLPMGAGKPIRIQGAYISDEEIYAVVEYAKNQAEPEYTEGVTAAKADRRAQGRRPRHRRRHGRAVLQAVELVVTSQFGSTSMLQRKLRVGFAKAGRLMDLMETRGIVGPRRAPRRARCWSSPTSWRATLMAIRGGGARTTTTRTRRRGPTCC